MIKLPPHNEEAERQIIGMMLIEKDAIDVITEKLSENDFYNTKTKKLFKIIKNSEYVNLLSVTSEIKDDIELIEYVRMIALDVFSTVEIDYYIKEIKNDSIKRQIIEISNTLISLAHKDVKAVDMLSKAESALFNISTENTSEIKKLSDVSDYVQKNYDILTDTQYKTGISSIDEKIVLRDGQFFIFAGHPGSGKTALISNILANISEEIPVGFFSQETSTELLNLRIGHTVGHTNLGYYERWKSGRERIDKLKMYVDETTGLTPYQLRSKANRMIRQYGVTLFALDYIQLAEGEGDSQLQKEINISKAINKIAKDTKTCWLIISQMNKEGMKEKFKNMTSIKGSGQIIQDARGIYFVERSEGNNVKFICSKQNYGATGWTAELGFDRKNNLFTLPVNEDGTMKNYPKWDER